MSNAVLLSLCLNTATINALLYSQLIQYTYECICYTVYTFLHWDSDLHIWRDSNETIEIFTTMRSSVMQMKQVTRSKVKVTLRGHWKTLVRSKISTCKEWFQYNMSRSLKMIRYPDIVRTLPRAYFLFVSIMPTSLTKVFVTCVFCANGALVSKMYHLHSIHFCIYLNLVKYKIP
jgi:hypothetical protein